MEDITVSCKGVVKLLKNLKPHKAAGPDDIPLIIIIMVIFKCYFSGELIALS